MAMPWPHGTPTLPRSAPALSASEVRPDRTDADRRELSQVLEPVRAIAASPVTALVAMLVGLALLFVLPLIGLPFVAVVVLPAVVYQLQAERRARFRR